jgi:uncharacterized membrane-anchored protein
MRLTYTDHAKQRIKERGIEEWEIEHIIKYPTYTKKVKKGRIAAYSKTKNRMVKIIYKDMENYKKVFSVMFP